MDGAAKQSLPNEKAGLNAKDKTKITPTKPRNQTNEGQEIPPNIKDNHLFMQTPKMLNVYRNQIKTEHQH